MHRLKDEHEPKAQDEVKQLLDDKITHHDDKTGYWLFVFFVKIIAICDVLSSKLILNIIISYTFHKQLDLIQAR